MNENQLNQSKTLLLRVAVWGQVMGFLLMAYFLAMEDAPQLFKRISPWNVIVPILVVIVIQMKRPSNFVIQNISTGLLSIFILIVSISTTAIAAAYLTHAFSIPEFLVSSGWQYTRITAIFVTIVFSLALIANIVFLVRTLRIQRRAAMDVKD